MLRRNVAQEKKRLRNTVPEEHISYRYTFLIVQRTRWCVLPKNAHLVYLSRFNFSHKFNQLRTFHAVWNCTMYLFESNGELPSFASTSEWFKVLTQSFWKRSKLIVLCRSELLSGWGKKKKKKEMAVYRNSVCLLRLPSSRPEMLTARRPWTPRPRFNAAFW